MFRLNSLLNLDMKNENTKWKVEFASKIFFDKPWLPYTSAVRFHSEETWQEWLRSTWRDLVLPALVLALSFTFIFVGMRLLLGI